MCHVMAFSIKCSYFYDITHLDHYEGDLGFAFGHFNHNITDHGRSSRISTLEITEFPYFYGRLATLKLSQISKIGTGKISEWT